jgi:hypothetical protein
MVRSPIRAQLEDLLGPISFNRGLDAELNLDGKSLFYLPERNTNSLFVWLVADADLF